MKLEKLIEQVLNQELQELSKPEAPKGAPFGQYFNGEKRKDTPKEPNSKEETKAVEALRYYMGSEIGRLPDIDSVFLKLIKLQKKGYYKDVLSPPNKLVYRFMGNLNPTVASSILRLPVNSIISSPNKAWYVEGGGTYKPSYNNVSSWTIAPTSPDVKDFTGTATRNVALVLVARANKRGKWLLNPTKSYVALGNEYLEGEQEVLSYGPVKFIEAAFYYYDSSKPYQEPVIKTGFYDYVDKHAALLRALALKT